MAKARAWWFAARVAGALAVVCLAPSPPGADVAPEPCTEASLCRGRLELEAGGFVHLYRSLPLERNVRVRRAVAIVHGNQRDADRYFERLVAAAEEEGRLRDTVLVAPNFRTLKDHPSAGEHPWSSQGWKIGHRSVGPNPVSSFAVVDELLGLLCSADDAIFPSLETVVLIGHSAGGQFVNRYAAAGRGCPNEAIESRYVVMNPSSYLYVDSRRRSPATGRFEVPVKPACSDYDDYKYGLRDLNRYLRRIGPERIRANLFGRRTVYLAGSEDTATGGSLDTSCPARLQGLHRRGRHANYRAYHLSFPDWKGATFEVVRGVGHDGGRMLLSDASRRAAFR